MGALRTLLLIMMFAGGSMSVMAEDKPITPEFAAEGIDKAVAALNEMVEKINDLERAEQAPELEQIMNSIKFRNVRKKYGKVELTDESRARLIEANIAVGEALKSYITRAALPYQLREMLEEQASNEKITEEINKCKTLRETME